MNILIVGLGSIARKHIEAIRFLKYNVTIYALRSASNAVHEDGIINIFSLDNLDITFDFAIISNPTNLHSKFIELLTEKGINLFIEKPPVNSIDNFGDLIERIEEAKNLTYTACNLRFHPCLQYLKKEFTDNSRRINEVNVYCGSYLPEWRPGKDYTKVYSSSPEMGGGVHLDLFHELDYTYWLFGKPDDTRSLKRNVSALNIKAFDYANYIFEYKYFAVNIVLNYYRRKPKRTIEVLFENGIWTIDLVKGTITDENDIVIFTDSNFTITKTYVDQMDYFINSLKFGNVQMNTLAESFEVLKLCLKDG